MVKWRVLGLGMLAAAGVLAVVAGFVLVVIPLVRDGLAWRTATSTDTSTAYGEYLAQFPEGRRAPMARANFDERSWRDVVAQHRLPAYQRYLEALPSGKHAGEAGTAIESLRWDDARRTNTDSAYRAYLADYTAGAHAGEAKAAVEDLTWAAAGRTDTVASLDGYVQSYPSGRYVKQAQERTDDILWAGAAAANTVAAYEGYVRDRPGGKYAAQAQVAIDGLRSPFGTVRGRVFRSDNNRSLADVAEVAVELNVRGLAENDPRRKAATVTADADGNYVLRNIPPGNYYLVASAKFRVTPEVVRSLPCSPGFGIGFGITRGGWEAITISGTNASNERVLITSAVASERDTLSIMPGSTFTRDIDMKCN